jgi:AcrR family transcriptional regulator
MVTLQPVSGSSGNFGPRAINPPCQKRSRETHERILKAAEALLNKKDFEQISIAEIASEANISVGNFYNRFADKTAMLYCLYENYEDQRTRHMLLALDPEKWGDKDLETSVKNITTLIVDLFLERTGLIRSFVSFMRNNPAFGSDRIRQRLMKVYETAADLLLIHQNRFTSSNPKRAAAHAVWMISAMCREHILYASLPMQQRLAFERNDYINEFSRMVLGYLLGPAPSK